MPRRLAASCAGYAAFARARHAQCCEELRATHEDRPYRALAAPVFGLGGEEECVAAMRAVPATDLCATCHKLLDGVSMHSSSCSLCSVFSTGSLTLCFVKGWILSFLLA